MANSRQLAEAGVCVWTVASAASRLFFSHPSELYSVSGDWAPQSRHEPAIASPSTCVSPLEGHTVAPLRRERETPLLQAEDDTKCCFFSLCGLVCECVFGAQSSVPLHFSFARQFQQDYYCSLFYQVWQTCQCFIFRAVCPEILAYCPLEHKTDWTDVSDTLCDASAADAVCT